MSRKKDSHLVCSFICMLMKWIWRKALSHIMHMSEFIQVCWNFFHWCYTYPYLMSADVNQTIWLMDFFCTLACLFVTFKVNPVLECSATYITLKVITLGVFPGVHVNIADMEEGLQCLNAGFSRVVGLVFHRVIDLVECRCGICTSPVLC